MAVGWAGDNAVNEQIEDSIKDEISRVRKNVPGGESLEYCEECGEEIPEGRRKAMPGVRLCISCQEKVDKQNRAVSLYNRRAAKTVSSNKCYLISEKRIILRKILSYENGRKFYHYGCRLTFANLTGLSAYSSATQPGMGCVFFFLLLGCRN